jgi:formate dehydrogenase subunit delta
MTGNRLIPMANQIAGFFRTQPKDKAVAGTRDHLMQFWNPVMLRDLKQMLDHGADEVDPLVRQAMAEISVLKSKAAG